MFIYTFTYENLNYHSKLLHKNALISLIVLTHQYQISETSSNYRNNHLKHQSQTLFMIFKLILILDSKIQSIIVIKNQFSKVLSCRFHLRQLCFVPFIKLTAFSKNLKHQNMNIWMCMNILPTLISQISQFFFIF